jgi:hypothetical protein
MLRIRKLLVLSVSGALAVSCAVAFGAPPVKLSTALESALRTEIVPAYQQGNALRVLEKFSTLLPRISEPQIAAMDALLAENELPSVGRMLVEARLAMVEQKLADQLPKAHPREVLLVVPEFQQGIAETLAVRADHPLFGNSLPQPASFEEYERLFWEAQMLQQRLLAAAQVAEHGRQLVLSMKGANLRLMSQQDRAVLETDFGSLLAQLAHMSTDLQEREVALRVRRFEFAANIIEQSNEFKQRFLAAWAVDSDGDQLAEFFKPAKDQQRFALDELNRPELAATIAAKTSAARSKAGDLIKKSRLFQMGLQWWLRGRYGHGPEGQGMLKSQLALVSPQAEFGLYMPLKPPEPTDPMTATSQLAPEVDRRHHYIWMFEYRKITASSQRGMVASGNVKEDPNNFSYAYKYLDVVVSEWAAVTKSVSPDDSRMVRRLVGFLEYRHALMNLDSLVRMSAANELDVYDQLVKDRREFVVYTNLSRRVERGPSSLSEPRVPGDNFERRGLRWITALARVELGAMLAAFTDVPNAFEAIAAPQFDGQEYQNLLLDGIRSHYWALQNDPALLRVKGGADVGTETLAYSRRTRLAGQMLLAAGKSGKYSPAQYQEIESWRTRLGALHFDLVAKIASHVDRPEVSRGGGTRRSAAGLASEYQTGFAFSDVPFNTGRDLTVSVLQLQLNGVNR